MWIDTHIHANASQFSQSDWQVTQNKGVIAQIIPSTTVNDWLSLPLFSEQFSNRFFTLGIHPFFINTLPKNWFTQLETHIKTYLNHSRFIGLGEIGLDFSAKSNYQNEQINIFESQLQLAKKYQLPVILHSYKSVDICLKYLKKYQIKQCISHAFSGSKQQAEQYIKYHYKLGFGGAFTYSRANRLKKLIKTLPIDCFVLETDAPFMPPEWIAKQTNYGYHLPQIAKQFAKIRKIEENVLSKLILENTKSISFKLNYIGIT